MSNGDWERRIEKIENTTDSIQSDVKEIKLALAGSDKVGLKGFATRMNDAECYIEKDRKLKNKIIGGITVLGIGWGAFKLFFHKIFEG